MANNGKGFTLVEILVVLSIITILLTIVYPTAKAHRDAALKKAHKAEYESINAQIMLHYLNNDAYPTAMTSSGWTGTIDSSEGRDHLYYFPAGVPTICNQSSSWSINTITGTINEHSGHD